MSFNIQKYVEERKAILLAHREQKVKSAETEYDIHDAFIAYMAAVGELDLLLYKSNEKPTCNSPKIYRWAMNHINCYSLI